MRRSVRQGEASQCEEEGDQAEKGEVGRGQILLYGDEKSLEAFRHGGDREF